jgi:hypothetical protein
MLGEDVTIVQRLEWLATPSPRLFLNRAGWMNGTLRACSPPGDLVP